VEFVYHPSRPDFHFAPEKDRPTRCGSTDGYRTAQPCMVTCPLCIETITGRPSEAGTIARLRSKLTQAREALKTAEYAADVLEDGRYIEVCPLCRYSKESGHSGGCVLAAALAAVEGES
jgi:hypothetical protein